MKRSIPPPPIVYTTITEIKRNIKETQRLHLIQVDAEARTEEQKFYNSINDLVPIYTKLDYRKKSLQKEIRLKLKKLARRANIKVRKDAIEDADENSEDDLDEEIARGETGDSEIDETEQLDLEAENEDDNVDDESEAEKEDSTESKLKEATDEDVELDDDLLGEEEDEEEDEVEDEDEDEEDNEETDKKAANESMRKFIKDWKHCGISVYPRREFLYKYLSTRFLADQKNIALFVNDSSLNTRGHEKRVRRRSGRYSSRR